ncbi:MAG: murein hydrolase activator EnvC family protein [Acidimicrobiales bacterium]
MAVAAALAVLVVLTAAGGAGAPPPPVGAAGSAEAAPSAARGSQACGWAPAVAAAIVDPFRVPTHPYGPGNRGIEYGTVGGEPVAAVDDGRVTFAGPVGGRRYVVVEHDSGLRSTYGPLASAAVVRDQTVTTGHPLGTAAVGLHLTARRGDRYVDPAPLLAGACGRPRLVDGR